MTGKRLRKPLSVLALGALLGQPAVAQVEGPVEQGLTQLASQIVARSTAAGKTTVAVLPFPNADGSCSVLSNFIVDELIQRLFTVPGSQIQIVERAQLETVINELRLGASGLLNPETTKRLGSQSGVSALTVGTITVIGDRVRINARLIATDTGMAISAAAVDIPKVAAVSELLSQPVTTGPTCAPRSTGANIAGTPPTAEPRRGPGGPSPGGGSSRHAPGLPVEVFMVQCRGGCPEKPEGTSVAVLLDRRPPTLSYGAVLEDRRLAPYRENILGLRWSGLFQITEPGRHIFSLIPESLSNCKVTVKMQDQPILNWNWNMHRSVVSGEASLDPGFHALEIWMACINRREYQQVNFRLQMRGPGDQTVAPIPSTRLVHTLP
jgi:TolB-like protein